MELVNFKKVLSQLSILAQCRRYGLSLWQCPQFLFLIMGIIIIGTAVIAYAIGNRYIEDPTLISLIILLLTAILLIITFIIIQGFERLAEANRMKSEFISVVSHQLRSPLSNLRWAIELLMSGRIGKIEEKQTEYFKILKENNSRMEELVSDLLTVSRIEQRTLPLKKREFSLENLIKNLILEFKPLIQASNVEVKFKSEEDLPEILADPSQIRLVIGNLLDNAIRYIPARQSPGADRPIAGGKDKGEVRIKLEKKGGKIGFSSQEGVGSTFWFSLPC